MSRRLKTLVEDLHPLHRTLVSDGTDEALNQIGGFLPAQANYTQETYAPGTAVWTWQVPERFVAHEAYLEIEGGDRVIDFAHNPLHIVSYSLPIDQVLTWDELAPHLHIAERRPDAIPWVFKFYERSWGFCLSKTAYDRLPRDTRYHAVIRSEFVEDPAQGLRIGVGVVHPEGGAHLDAGELVINAHVCHPSQSNDDLAGVSVAVEVANRLAENPLPPGSMSIRFLFAPETIGSISYLAHHEDLIPTMKGGIFCEMLGSHTELALQRTRQDDHLLDRIAQDILNRRGVPFHQGPFREVVRNDEMVFNGPGVNIPMISLSRWPYDEYHTSDDSPAIIHEDMLVEAADIIEEIVRIYATDFIPQRTFRGPVFLSGYGLWVDPKINRPLNRATERIFLRFEGDRTVYQIAEEVEMDYWEVRDFIMRFVDKGLVNKLPLPTESAHG